MKPETLEKYIVQALGEIPLPKFKDFAKVEADFGDRKEIRQITGRHWVGVVQAWEEQSIPGWHYTLWSDLRPHTIYILHESDLQEVENV